MSESIYGWYWDSDNCNSECEVLDVNGSLVYIEDIQTEQRNWISVNDVMPAALDEWHEANNRKR